MRRTSDWQQSVLLVTTCVAGFFWQFLVAAFAVAVGLGYVSSSQADGIGYEHRKGTSAGMDCLLPTGDPDSVESKLFALSCMGLHTSYSTWAVQTDSLADCIARSAPGSQSVANEVTCTWLKRGNWRCSMLPFFNGPHAACLRHDMNYATLQYLDGTAGFHRLDEYWNPRNKHLADDRFRNDMRESSSDAPWPVDRAFWGVSAFLHWFTNRANNKTWPVTAHDIEDTREHPYFRKCDIPTVKDVRVNLRGHNAQAGWTYALGCVDEIEADSYRVCWKVDLPAHLYIVYPHALTEFCRTLDAASAEAKFTVPAVIFGWRSVKLVSVEVRPDDIVYGGPIGSETILGSRMLDRVLGGAYYPVQKLDLAVAR